MTRLTPPTRKFGKSTKCRRHAALNPHPYRGCGATPPPPWRFSRIAVGAVGWRQFCELVCCRGWGRGLCGWLIVNFMKWFVTSFSFMFWLCLFYVYFTDSAVGWRQFCELVCCRGWGRGLCGWLIVNFMKWFVTSFSFMFWLCLFYVYFTDSNTWVSFTFAPCYGCYRMYPVNVVRLHVTWLGTVLSWMDAQDLQLFFAVV